MGKRSTGIGNFAAGGDAIARGIWLALRNAMRAMLFGIGVGVLFSCLMLYSNIDREDAQAYLRLQQADFMTNTMMGDRDLKFEFRGREIAAKAKAWAGYLPRTDEIERIKEEFVDAMLWGGGVGIVAVLAIGWLYFATGRKINSEEFVEGQEVVSPKALKKLVKTPSPIHVGEVPIPADMLGRNVLAVGSMGTGKSQAFNSWITAARAWGKKLIIYDASGEYVEKFFRPGIDILLNPLDARCAAWSILADMPKRTDAAMLAQFLIPEAIGGQPGDIFDKAARQLLADLLILARTKGKSMAWMKEQITQTSLEDLYQLLASNKMGAAATLTPGNPRGAESVRLTAAAQPAVQFLDLFATSGKKFSIREFVRREAEGNLFITSGATQGSICRPFAQIWIETALAEAMSGGSSPIDVRLMFFLDELDSLGKLPSLSPALTQGRKFGIATFGGLQNLAQIEHTFGQAQARTFTAGFQNKLVLRVEEDASAKQLSRSLGEKVLLEVTESQSAGIKESRDGVNLGSQRAERPVVSYTEIMTLPDLTGYLKIAGSMPLAKVSYRYVPRPAVAAGFVERQDLDLDAVEAAAHEAQAQLPQVPAEAVQEPDYFLPYAEGDGKPIGRAI